MELSIQKWGNSAAVRLPTALLDQLKLVLGDKLSVDIRPEGVMLLPIRILQPERPPAKVAYGGNWLLPRLLDALVPQLARTYDCSSSISCTC